MRSAGRLLHQSLDNSPGVEAFEVGVGLSRADEDDGLARGVRHRDGGSDLRTNNVSEISDRRREKEAGWMDMRVT